VDDGGFAARAKQVADAEGSERLLVDHRGDAAGRPGAGENELAGEVVPE
jgi:hypothetical protein